MSTPSPQPVSSALALLASLEVRDTAQQDPENASLWIVLARVSANAGDHQEAAAAWERVAALDPALAKSAHFERARLLGLAGQWEAAREAMGEAAHRCDFDTDANLAKVERERMARLYAKLGHQEGIA